MCGIAGFISPNLKQEHLHLITRALQHRGPDAEGFEINSNSNQRAGHQLLKRNRENVSIDLIAYYETGNNPVKKGL